MIKQLVLLCAASAVSACSPPQAQEPPTEFSINGLKFGQTYADAMIAVHPYQFAVSSILDCQRNLALRGCALRAENLNAPFISADGIPLTLLAKFDQRDRLYDFSLSYLATDATDAECLGVAMRGADWLAREYAPPVIMQSREGDSPVQMKKTPDGHPIGFHHGKESDRDYWLTARSEVRMRDVTIFILTSYFAQAGNGECHLWLSFENPFHEKSDSIE